MVAAFVEDYERVHGPYPTNKQPGMTEYKRFLLSTDFFQNGADESRPLRYVRIFDAYASPCYQPLAHFGDA